MNTQAMCPSFLPTPAGLSPLLMRRRSRKSVTRRHAEGRERTRARPRAGSLSSTPSLRLGVSSRSQKGGRRTRYY